MYYTLIPQTFVSELALIFIDVREIFHVSMFKSVESKKAVSS